MSLLRFLLDILKPGERGALNMKRHGMLVGKFEFNTYETLMLTLPELHYTPKRFHLKRNRFDY